MKKGVKTGKKVVKSYGKGATINEWYVSDRQFVDQLNKVQRNMDSLPAFMQAFRGVRMKRATTHAAVMKQLSP